MYNNTGGGRSGMRKTDACITDSDGSLYISAVGRGVSVRNTYPPGMERGQNT